MAVTIPASGYISNNSRTKGEIKVSLEELRDAIETIDINTDQNSTDIADLYSQISEITTGIPAWRNDVNYVVNAVVLGSNESVYIAVQANGPATVIIDPVTDTGEVYWRDLLPDASETERGSIFIATVSDVITGTDNTKAVSPAGLSNRQATETLSGIAEIATTAEIATGTDNTKIVTPAGLVSRQSTDTSTGLIRIATVAEAQALTETDLAITPNTLGQVAATETSVGVAEIATQAEVSAGVDNTKIVTPYGLTSVVPVVDTSWVNIILAPGYTVTNQDPVQMRLSSDGRIVYCRGAYSRIGASSTSTIIESANMPPQFVVNAAITKRAYAFTTASSPNANFVGYQLPNIGQSQPFMSGIFFPNNSGVSDYTATFEFCYHIDY